MVYRLRCALNIRKAIEIYTILWKKPRGEKEMSDLKSINQNCSSVLRNRYTVDMNESSSGSPIYIYSIKATQSTQSTQSDNPFSAVQL